MLCRTAQPDGITTRYSRRIMLEPGKQPNMPSVVVLADKSWSACEMLSTVETAKLVRRGRPLFHCQRALITCWNVQTAVCTNNFFPTSRMVLTPPHFFRHLSPRKQLENHDGPKVLPTAFYFLLLWRLFSNLTGIPTEIRMEGHSQLD